MAEDKAKEEAAPKTKKSKKKLIAIVLGVLVLSGIGGVSFSMLSGSSEPEKELSLEEKRKKLEKEHAHFPTTELEPIIVNLGAKDSFLSVTIQLEWWEKEEGAGHGEGAVDPEVAKIRDTLISILSEKTIDDLLAKGGQKKLKKELVKALNKELKEEPIRSVYFTRFVVQ